MNRVLRATPVVASLFLWGCAAFAPPDPQIQAAVDEFEAVQQIHDAFLDLPDALPRLEDMASYSPESVALLSTQSLRKAPLGSALLSKHAGSLLGHAMLHKFYLENDESVASNHEVWLERLISHATYGRDGSLNNPYRAFTLHDAVAQVLTQGEEVIGSMYATSAEHGLLAYLLTKNEEGHNRRVFFEVQSFPSLQASTGDPDKTDPIDVIRALASKRDQAAAIAYGVYLLEHASNNKQEEDKLISVGTRWLHQAGVPPNALAPYFLANFAVVHRNKGIQWDAVRELYENSIQLGNTDAQVQLGKLYLSNVFGADMRREGLNLLEQATELNNVDAASSLASLLLTSNTDDAIGYLRQAAELGGDRHKIAYIRLITRPDYHRSLDQTTFDWLSNLAEADHQEAMLLLGNVHAKGLYNDKVSYRKANRWYRKSVEVKPDDGENVNEVAWILATTNLRKLRNPSLAVRYMETLMLNNEQARNEPAYIDTWAAAYAATGDFTKALKLQKEALQIAISSNQNSAIEQELISHLNEYEEQKALTEEVP